MSGIEYVISQRFPILKKLSLRRKLAGFDVKMLQAQMQERLSALRFQLLRELIELAYLRKAMKSMAEEHQLMVQAAAVARTLYTVNRAPQQNMLQAMTAQSQLRSEMIGLVSRATQRRQRMALWLGHATKSLQAQAIVAAPTTWPQAKQTARRGLQVRGAARRWQIAARKAKTLLAFARAQYLPDVTVQLSVRQRFPNPMDSGVPFLSLGVKVPIPSGGNAARHGLVKEAMALHVYARSRSQTLKARWLSQAQIALSKAQQYRRQRKIVADQIIPLALQTYRSALANYQVGRVTFLTLIGNLRTIYKEKLRLHRLDADLAIAHATLEAVAGKVK